MPENNGHSMIIMAPNCPWPAEPQMGWSGQHSQVLQLLSGCPDNWKQLTRILKKKCTIDPTRNPDATPRNLPSGSFRHECRTSRTKIVDITPWTWTKGSPMPPLPRKSRNIVPRVPGQSSDCCCSVSIWGGQPEAEGACWFYSKRLKGPLEVHLNPRKTSTHM